MAHPMKNSTPAVQSLDKSVLCGKRAPRLRQVRRFHEAIPEYMARITERTGLPPEPFVSLCCHRWVERWSRTTLAGLRTKDLQSYFSALVDHGSSPRDLRKEKALLVSFYRWAQRHGWVSASPMTKLGQTRTPPTPYPIAWTSVEQRRLLEACRGSTPARKPWGALRSGAPPAYLYPLVLICMRTGLRLRHLVHLRWCHVDLVTGRLTVPAHEAKNGYEIDVPLDGDCCEALDQLLRQNQKPLLLPRRIFEPADLPLSGERPEEHAALQAFHRARKIARVREGDFGSVRLTFAGNCARAGVPVSYPLRVGDWDDPELLRKLYQEMGARRARRTA